MKIFTSCDNLFLAINIFVQISEELMDHGVFNISATNLCSKLISVKLEVDHKCK